MTLMGVRADGVATFVDLMPMETKDVVQARARWLLGEHASCDAVEIWCGGTLVDRIERMGPGAMKTPEDRRSANRRLRRHPASEPFQSRPLGGARSTP